MERIYFDNAATTTLDPLVLEAMMPYLTEKFGNPSSIYSYGRESRLAIENARKSVAKILNAHPAEIFFTSGGTESSNTAIMAAVRDLGCTHIISSPLEHHATLHTVEHLHKRGEASLSWVKLLPNGHIDMEDLERTLMSLASSPEKTIVSLMHANNEIGTLSNMEQIGDLCEHYNAIYHADTVQAMGHYQHDLSRLKAHFVVCAAHKLHGPKGIGFLHVNHKVKIKPFIYGGSQERNMRGGTENVYGIVGLAKALELAYANMDQHQHQIQSLKTYMIGQLKENIPAIEFNGETDPNKSLYTVLNVSFPCSDMADMMLFNLDIAGISASGGSACSSGSDIGSHVLTAIGGDPARPSVRFSFSKYNTKEEVDYTVSKVKELCMTYA